MIGCAGCAEFAQQGNVTDDHPYCPLSGHVCVRYVRLSPPTPDAPEGHEVTTLRGSLRETGSMLVSGLLWVVCAASPRCFGSRIHRWCSCCSPMTCVRCGRKDPWT